jgi:hypothetical protein
LNFLLSSRIKSYQFDKYHFGFDLPKPLSLGNIAIVGFFLKYDYYSDRSILSKCRVRINEYTYGMLTLKILHSTFFLIRSYTGTIRG